MVHLIPPVGVEGPLHRDAVSQAAGQELPLGPRAEAPAYTLSAAGVSCSGSLGIEGICPVIVYRRRF